MRRTDWHRQRRAAAILALAAALIVLAGCGTVDQLTGALYPTEVPVAAEPTAEAITAPTEPALPTAVALPTAAEMEAPAATPAPTVDGLYGLVYAQSSSLYLGDVLGRDAAEVAVGASLESWAFGQGRLATAIGRQVDVIDLTRGSIQSYTMDVPGELMHTRVLWGESADTLLYAAVVADGMAANYGRSAVLRAVAADTGTILGQATLPDVTAVLLLRYDEATGQALIAPQGGDPSLPEIQYWDLASGTKVRQVPIASDGVASVSPDGHYLLTASAAAATSAVAGADAGSLYLYDLATDEPAAQALALPEGTHSVAHVWAPGSDRVAYLLRDGLASYEATEGRGVWVLDVAALSTTEILPEAELGSTLISWTPDGALLVGYHRGLADGSYFYSVRPDGSDRQMLTLEAGAQVLGWMSLPEMRVMTRLTIDPWPARIRAAAESATADGSADALAEVVAQYVAEQGPADDADLTARLREYWNGAGIEGQPTVRRAAEGLFVAQLPPMSIYAMYSGRSQMVATGDTVFDARAQDDDLALIYGVADAQATQPAFVLLRRDADGAWQPLWTPQGQGDWIATNGRIEFSGDGVESIRVSGTSFGLDDGEEAPFAECAECPHRQLVSTWQREEDAYVRPDAPEETLLPGDLYWMMTERTPYAVVYETLRRLRRGDAIDDLVAGNAVERQLRALGLAGSEERLIAEQETGDTVILRTGDGETRYLANVQGGLLVGVEQLP